MLYMNITFHLRGYTRSSIKNSTDVKAGSCFVASITDLLVEHWNHLVVAWLTLPLSSET
jgi:hypothetical protein